MGLGLGLCRWDRGGEIPLSHKLVDNPRCLTLPACKWTLSGTQLAILRDLTLQIEPRMFNMQGWLPNWRLSIFPWVTIYG